MSKVLNHLAEPPLEMTEGRAGFERAIRATADIWNCLVRAELPRLDADLARAEAKYTAAFALRERKSAREEFRLIAERKARFYPHLDNDVIDLRFYDKKDGSTYVEVLHGIRV